MSDDPLDEFGFPISALEALSRRKGRLLPVTLSQLDRAFEAHPPEPKGARAVQQPPGYSMEDLQFPTNFQRRR
jgi:hypothetical protein